MEVECFVSCYRFCECLGEWVRLAGKGGEVAMAEVGSATDVWKCLWWSSWVGNGFVAML